MAITNTGQTLEMDTDKVICGILTRHDGLIITASSNRDVQIRKGTYRHGTTDKISAKM